MSKKDNRTYAHIPISAIKDKRFQNRKTAFRVLAAICSYSDFSGLAFPNQSTLAKILGVSRTSISRQIKILMDMGYIMKSFYKPSIAKYIKGNCYFIKFDKDTSQKQAVANTTEIQKEFKPPMVDNEIVNKLGKKADYPSSSVTLDVSSNIKKGIYYKEENKEKEKSKTNKDIDIIQKQFMEKSRIVCNSFKLNHRRFYGMDINYYLKNMEEIAQFIKEGITTEDMIKTIQEGYHYLRRVNKEPPHSIRYFYKGFKRNKSWSSSSRKLGVADIVNRTRNKMKG